MSTAALPHQIIEAALHGREALTSAIAEQGGTPLRHDGHVTLVHVGRADSVALRHWLDIFPPIPEFHRLDGSDAWAASFPMPGDARFEYKLAVHSHGRQRLYIDQLNQSRVANPWGFNSELLGADYRSPTWATLLPGVARGTVTRLELESEVYGSNRPVHIYTPAAGDARALLVVHDGDDYLRFAGLAKVLDNLIAAGEIPPVAAVLADPDNRLAEYRASPAHAAHIVEEVIPLAVREVATSHVVGMGASLGGVAALHAAWTYPGAFAGLILQAGSFVAELGGPFDRGPVFGPVTRFMARFNSQMRPLPARIHVSSGRFDGLIGEARRMADTLTERGVDVGYADVAAGHDWHTWRDLLRSGLIHMFGDEEKQQ